MHKHYSGSISSKSNQLCSSPTSITHAPPSKDVGRVRKHSPTPFKQHGCQHHLPLPSPSTLPRHSTSSIENASPGLLLPSSATSLDAEHRGCLPQSATALTPSALPCHPTSSVKDTLGLPPPSSLPRHLMLSIEDTSPGLPLPLHPLLCHVTQHRALRTPLVCHRPPLCHIISHLALRMRPPACYCPIKSPAMPRNTS